MARKKGTIPKKSKDKRNATLSRALEDQQKFENRINDKVRVKVLDPVSTILTLSPRRPFLAKDFFVNISLPKRISPHRLERAIKQLIERMINEVD